MWTRYMTFVVVVLWMTILVLAIILLLQQLVAAI